MDQKTIGTQDNIEQNGNTNKEMEIILQNKAKVVEVKSLMTKMKID